jgi:hypothetical protein
VLLLAMSVAMLVLLLLQLGTQASERFDRVARARNRVRATARSEVSRDFQSSSFPPNAWRTSFGTPRRK